MGSEDEVEESEGQSSDESDTAEENDRLPNHSVVIKRGKASAMASKREKGRRGVGERRQKKFGKEKLSLKANEKSRRLDLQSPEESDSSSESDMITPERTAKGKRAKSSKRVSKFKRPRRA